MRYKTLALLLTLIMALQNILVFAETSLEDTNIYDQSIGSPIKLQQYDALSEMGLLIDDFLEVNDNDKVTRAQFVGQIYKLAGFMPKGNNQVIPFIDVNINTPYKDAITYFYNIGVLKGATGSAFEPDRYISYAEAIKIIVSVLGYEDYTLKICGEYPVGYATMAKKLGVTDGVKVYEFDEQISAESAIKLIYNCGITPISEGKTYSSNGTVLYGSDENGYLLSLYNSIYYGEGIMTNNGLVSLDGEACSIDSVKIGGKFYKTINNNSLDLLGCKIKYFYKKINDFDTILWASVREDINTTLLIESEDLLPDDAEYSLTKVVYQKNDKEKTANINKYADIVYNNSLCNNCGVSRISPRTGNIKLVDNNGDGIYDVVIVNEFENIFATSISVDKRFILDKYGKTIALDDYDYVKIFSDGEEIEFEDIVNNRVLSCIESLDEKTIFIYVNDAGFAETLQTKTSKSGEEYYKLENGEYKLSNSLKDIILAGVYEVPSIEIGKMYTFYLDMSGNIASIEKFSGENPQYAYLLNAIMNEDTFSNNTVAKVNFILKDGENIVALTAKRLKINGNAGKTGADLLTLLSGKVMPQVVMVSFNGNGELREINFAEPVKNYSDYGYKKDVFTLDYTSSDAYFTSGNASMFNYKYSVTGDSVCFANFQNVDGSIEYGVIPYSKIKSSERYNLKVYDCDEYFVAAAISLDIKTYVNTIGGHILVNEVSKVLHTDGEVYVQLEGLNFGKTVKYLAEDDGTIPESIKRGDIVTISVYNSRIKTLTKICSLSENPAPFIKGEAGAEFCQVFGPLYANNSRMIVTVNPQDYKYGKLLPTSAWGTTDMLVSVYDAKTDTVSVCGVNDVHQKSSPLADGSIVLGDDCTKVFIYRRYNYVRELIVAYY